MIYLTAFPPQSSACLLPQLTAVLNADADNMWVSWNKPGLPLAGSAQAGSKVAGRENPSERRFGTSAKGCPHSTEVPLSQGLILHAGGQRVIPCNCKAQPSTSHSPNLLQEGEMLTKQHRENGTNHDIAENFKPRRGVPFLERLGNLSSSPSFYIDCQGENFTVRINKGPSSLSIFAVTNFTLI